MESPPPADRSRSALKRRLPWIGGVVALALVALAAAALLPGSHSGRAKPTAIAAVAAAQRSTTQVDPRVRSVYGSDIAARRYGSLSAAQSNGVDAAGNFVSDLTPLTLHDFQRPFHRFRVYAEHRARIMAPDVAALRTAVAAGDRAAAKRAWLRCWSDYLRLGAAYGLLPGDLDDALAEVPDSLDTPRFTGLHYLERGLWTRRPVRSLSGAAAALQRATARLIRTVPTLDIDPVDYAARAHEILEDAQRDLLSGTEVPWSGAGVLGTAAGLDATQELIRTLAPIMRGRNGTLVLVENVLPRLHRALESVRRPDGSYPTDGELSRPQRERINAAMAAALAQLQRIPSTVEAQNPPHFLMKATPDPEVSR